MQLTKEDNNKIMDQIKISYVFKVFRLVIILFTISYFIGTLFYVFSNLTKDRPNFVGANFSADESDIDRLIVVIYFAFTTLTTVGYGDYHAINNQERILFSFILLFGTAVFSFIMGNFIEILMSYKDVTADNEDSQSLTSWFGLMARFNKGRPLPKEMTRRIEAYFEYYWQNDKNYAIQSEEDKRFMKELPKPIRRNVY